MARTSTSRSDADSSWGADGVFARLAGDWRIARNVSNGASLDGTAYFTPAAGGALAYEERGLLRLADGQTFRAFRRYLFKPRSEGFAVFFADEPTKLFHAIALRSEGDALVGEGEHPCSNDLYRSRYEFHSDGSFTLIHIVKGPRYDYTMTTIYRRASQ